MDLLCIRVGTRPQPGTWPRVVVLIIIIVTVFVSVRLGYSLPDVITLILGAGLAGAQVTRALLAPPEPGSEPR